MALEPLSIVRPANVIVCADNLNLMRGLTDGCCDLIYVDPSIREARSTSPCVRGLCLLRAGKRSAKFFVVDQIHFIIRVKVK